MVVVQILLALLFGHDHSDRRLRRVGGGGHRILGPLFIPFLLVDKLSFLFWGWLRAFIGFSFYKVVAAAVSAFSDTFTSSIT